MQGRYRDALLLFSLCLLGLGPKSAMANQEGVPGAAAQSDSSFRMHVDVDLVTVEVFALDGKGKPMRGLKKEDFRLYEDGKQQEILSFDEMDEKSNTSSGLPLIDRGGPHRGKTVLIIFDDSAISPQNMKISRDTAERFVREHMQPQDLFAVAEYGMSMKVLQNFTGDREDVAAAIQKTSGASAGGALYFENLLRALDKIIYAIAQIKGQKSILIYSQSGFTSSYSTATLASTYAKTLDSARKSNVIFYTISPETLNSQFGGSSGMRGQMPRPGSMGGGRMDAITSLDPAVTLRSLATESGGFSIYDTNNFDPELDKLDQQISNYYILGFQSNNPKHSGAFRRLEVRTDLKGTTLKHKPGYQDRRPIDVLASSKQEKALLTALASPESATQLPINFRPAYFYDSPRSARVLIAAKLLTDKMTFRKKGGQMETDLNLMGVAYSEDGSIAARFSETLPISFEKEKEAEFRKANVTYRNYFKLRPGKYRLKLAVSDESNNLGAMEHSLEIPVFPEKGFAGSSLVLAEQLSQLPDLIKNLQAQLLDQSNPLIYSGTQIEPCVENRLPVNSPVLVLFRIYNLPNRSDQSDFVASVKLLNDKGEKYALPPIHLKEVMAPAGPAEAVVGLRLPFQNTPPGQYQLVMEITDTGSAQTTILQTDLEFVRQTSDK